MTADPLREKVIEAMPRTLHEIAEYTGILEANVLWIITDARKDGTSIEAVMDAAGTVFRAG